MNSTIVVPCVGWMRRGRATVIAGSADVAMGAHDLVPFTRSGASRSARGAMAIGWLIEAATTDRVTNASLETGVGGWNASSATITHDASTAVVLAEQRPAVAIGSRAGGTGTSMLSWTRSPPRPRRSAWACWHGCPAHARGASR